MPALACPAGKGLMGPIDAALRENRPFIPVRNDPLLRTTLQDFSTLIRLLDSRPTHCRELVVDDPGYVGYCDASKLGAGGVWLSGTRLLPPVVWRVEWPDDIRAMVVSSNNPTGTITNSDLEMAAMLLHFLVLEHLVCLKHVHVAAWCDNTPTVSWTNKLSSSKSMVASRLTRALALRIHANDASPLISVSIAGVHNQMADIASRTFRADSATSDTFRLSDDAFLRFFADSFPLQGDSWRVFRVGDKLSSRIFSELRGQTSTLGSWLRLTMKGSAIGTFGATTSTPSMVWTPCSPMCQTPSASNSFSVSLTGSGTATTGTALKCELAPFRSRYVPSGRPLSWMEYPTPPIEARAGTGSKLERLIEAYRRQDPPPQHKLAVPVAVVNHLVAVGQKSASDKLQASCDMSTIAFYFLLRVGEYTGHRRKERRRTKQFRACDIIFYDASDTIIPNTSTLAHLYTATTAVMRITNQKNGTRGSRISHTPSGTVACPVRALARRVHYIMSHSPCTDQDIISTYISPITKEARPLQSSDINKIIKSTVGLLGLDKKGFPPDSVSSHSLRAGGAMAMHLNGIDRDKIRKDSTLDFFSGPLFPDYALELLGYPSNGPNVPSNVREKCLRAIARLVGLGFSVQKNNS